MGQQGFVYIMGSNSLVLYVGSTDNLEERVYSHKTKTERSSFTTRYNVNKLLYYEAGESLNSALERERQIKGWKRIKKLNLIKTKNPYYKDIAANWFDD